MALEPFGLRLESTAPWCAWSCWLPFVIFAPAKGYFLNALRRVVPDVGSHRCTVVCIRFPQVSDDRCHCFGPLRKGVEQSLCSLGIDCAGEPDNAAVIVSPPLVGMVSGAKLNLFHWYLRRYSVALPMTSRRFHGSLTADSAQSPHSTCTPESPSHRLIPTA